jgi:hypothetical protein
VLRCFSVQACAFNSSLVIWFCVNRSCMILAADAGQYQYTRGCSMHKVFILSVFLQSSFLCKKWWFERSIEIVVLQANLCRSKFWI